MEKSADDSFAEKANLIYEFDNRSPLFVRKAEREIESQNLDSAITILRFGLNIYPDYPVPYMLLGKALALLGRYDEAKEVYTAGCRLIDSQESLQYHLGKVEEIKKLRSPFSINKRATFIEEPEAAVSQRKNIKYDEPQSETFEDRLPHLAEQLSKAKLSIPDDNDAPAAPVTLDDLPSSPPIVSETLAKIYISQGKLSDAIHIYELLILRNPDKKSVFMQAIKDLRAKMQQS